MSATLWLGRLHLRNKKWGVHLSHQDGCLVTGTDGRPAGMGRDHPVHCSGRQGQTARRKNAIIIVGGGELHVPAMPEKWFAASLFRLT